MAGNDPKRRLVVKALIPSYAPAPHRLIDLVHGLERQGVQPVVLANGETALRVAERAGLPHLAPGNNAGFGPSINWAVPRLGEWDWLLLSNDDITLSGDDVRHVTDGLPAGSQAALVHLDADVERAIPGPISVFGNLSLLARVLERSRVRDTRAPLGRYRSFSCVLISRGAWTATGGFDPDIPFTYEDADFVRRLAAAGGTVRLAHGAGVAHVGSVTSSSNVARVLPVSAWSAYRYLEKWGHPDTRARAVLIAALVLRVALLPFGRAAAGAHLRGVLGAITALLRKEPPPMPPYRPVTSLSGTTS